MTDELTNEIAEIDALPVLPSLKELLARKVERMHHHGRMATEHKARADALKKEIKELRAGFKDALKPPKKARARRRKAGPDDRRLPMSGSEAPADA